MPGSLKEGFQKMNIASLMRLACALVQGSADSAATDLKDGYSRVATSNYTVDVPNGWTVSKETPWGARKVQPTQGKGELGVMTAPPGQQSWDQLYQTALYFIQREEKGKATPYRLTKTPSGLEAASFDVVDAEGFASRRYVMIRDSAKGLFALSMKVPSREANKQWTKHFDRLIRSAKFKQ